jgi:hypothetical protein
MTIRQYLEQSIQEYRSISNEFTNYSPQNERYFGYVLMCEKVLHDLSDETLDRPISFREFNYCGECARYNNFHLCCKDDAGNEIKCLIFKDTEACDYFKSLEK